MVGLVLVSHSAGLAAGLTDLLAQLGTEQVPIVVAAGTADGGLGTDPDRVMTAIRTAAAGGDGVVVLPDLGSAVLSVRVALEDLEAASTAEERVGTVVLVDCPFVEGAVAAAVSAATGAGVHEVVRAAEESRGFRKL